MHEIAYMSAVELSQAIRRRELSPVDVVQQNLNRISEVNPAVNAFVTITADRALDEARAAERALMTTPAEHLPPLFGLPVSVKDLVDTAGVRTTYGSAQFTDNIPSSDGNGWARLRAAGAILIGKTTTPEFGALGVTESEVSGITSNPWDVTRTSGGSSGGAAAAVAAGMGALAWGTDGGGSIRIPAAFCGVVGFKASTGRIDQLGEQSPYDTVNMSGPIARSVEDVALMLSVVSGASQDAPFGLPPLRADLVTYLRKTTSDVLRIAYSPDLGQARVSVGVLAVVEAALKKVEADLGAVITTPTVSLPDSVEYFLNYWSPEIAAEYADDPEARAAAMEHPITSLFLQKASTISASQHYRTATETRELVLRGLLNALRGSDVLITPTSTVTAFPHAGTRAGNETVDSHPVTYPHLDFHRLTEPASHAGLPAITIPAGFDADGMPVGLQIIGPPRADELVLHIASTIEQNLGVNTRRPACGAHN
jgi:Asp-tRNA(Asn)/Glu-tRNA(Gln) amidotransferase A subunit family amidase